MGLLGQGLPAWLPYNSSAEGAMTVIGDGTLAFEGGSALGIPPQNTTPSQPFSPNARRRLGDPSRDLGIWYSCQMFETAFRAVSTMKRILRRW